jgi:hypothetical protein
MSGRPQSRACKAGLTFRIADSGDEAQTYSRTVHAPTAQPTRVAESVGMTLADPEMPRHHRLHQLTLAALIAVIAVVGLTACRKEVPPPPRPDEVPRPKVASSVYALPTAQARLGR